MTTTAKAKKTPEFNPHTFLATIGEGRKYLAVPKKTMVFTQGDEANAVSTFKPAK